MRRHSGVSSRPAALASHSFQTKPPCPAMTIHSSVRISMYAYGYPYPYPYGYAYPGIPFINIKTMHTVGTAEHADFISLIFYNLRLPPTWRREITSRARSPAPAPRPCGTAPPSRKSPAARGSGAPRRRSCRAGRRRSARAGRAGCSPGRRCAPRRP